ncbi:MAG: restriction endonuclease [Flavobacterium sp.]|nr:MAG: restriction endonuclease [Flavobacterium sp.]
MRELPIYATRELIHERLPLIFPEGTPNRNYCIREMAASTIFTMLYIGAIAGNQTYIGPIHVYRMTDEQASLTTDEDRHAYSTNVQKKSFTVSGNRWYADNTREPIRDETLREGLSQVGAVISLTNLPTTSSKPRYTLQKSFAMLFNPQLTDSNLLEEISKWQTANLSSGAMARIALAGRVSNNSEGRVLVTFPNGEARNITAGPSSEISKAVIEVFSQSFLHNPAVLWLSTSDAKVQYTDDGLASKMGLKIRADQNLPDIILADLGPSDPLLLFVEVVATDGAITDRRKEAIYQLTDDAGYKREQIAFLTAYQDRQKPGFKKTISGLAWNSFVWFMSEPDKIVYFKDGIEKIDNLLP